MGIFPAAAKACPRTVFRHFEPVSIFRVRFRVRIRIRVTPSEG